MRKSAGLVVSLALFGCLLACNGRVIPTEGETQPVITDPDPEPGPHPGYPYTTIKDPPPDPGQPGTGQPGTDLPIRGPIGAKGTCTAQLAVNDCAKELGYTPDVYTFDDASVDAQGRAIYYVGTYETIGHSSQNSYPLGEATVTDTAPNAHVLVVSAYAPTHWTIHKVAGSGLERVILSGVYAQSATADASVTVENHSKNDGFCAYSYPYNGGGCDTNAALGTVSGWTGGSVAAMAGCYQASDFTVGATCDVPVPTNTWQALAFTHDTTTSGCAGGKTYVQYNAKYGKWVGAELCAAESYKLYLAESRDGVYAPIADDSGDGEDHCELVNPMFTIPNDDDITSGDCSNCSNTPYEPWSWPGDLSVYVRGRFGEPFTLESWLKWEDGSGNPISPHITSSQYSCGVSIP